MKVDLPDYNRQQGEAAALASGTSSSPSNPEADRGVGPANSTLPSAQMLHSNQTVAGRYRIVRLLGKGGMGEVYAADDLELGERVALKILAPGMLGDPKAPENLKREILLARKVMHANICRTLEFGYHQPPGSGEMIAFLTMEFLPGETLSQRLKRSGRMETHCLLPIVAQVVAALSAAHKAGVVHRDLKPSNILLVLSEDGEYRPMISDFGLARRASGLESVSTTTSGGSGVSGTWAYMAPEQVMGEPATPQTDVYALGVVMFEMVTGALPFQGEDAISTAFKRLQQDAPAPSSLVPELSSKWENVILRCLMRDPEQRYQNITEVFDALSGEDAGIAPPIQGAARRRGGTKVLLSIFALILLLACVGSLYSLASYYSSSPAVVPAARTIIPPVKNADLPGSTAKNAKQTVDPGTLEHASKGAGVTGSTNVKSSNLSAAAQGGRLLTENARRFLAKGNLQEAGQAAAQSLGVLRSVDDPQGLERALRAAAEIRQRGGELPKARTLLDEALAIDQRTGDHAGAAAALVEMGSLLYEQGEIEAAKGIFEQAVNAAALAGNKGELARAHAGKGLVALEAGNPEEARTALESALSEARASGNKEAEVECQLSLCAVRLDSGDAAPAEQMARAAAQGSGTIGRRDLQLRADIMVATALLAEGKVQEARSEVESARGLAAAGKDPIGELSWGIAEAGVPASTTQARSLEWVRQTLEDIIKRAKKQGLTRQELKARLALGEAEMAAGEASSGRSRLAALAKKATVLGMRLTAAQADVARQGRAG